ncbi:MAG TPA: hydroxyacid dehydrogenase [Chloroflexi bacterium]|nr:hydroxyacid dehydrogenase [Chloroflexota bacterium]
MNPTPSTTPTSLNVHIPPSDLVKRVDALRALLPSHVRVTAAPDAQPEDCHILVHGAVKAEWLAASPNLRAVIVPYAGVSPEMQTLLQQYPQIALHNLHYNDVATAEFALALLFAAAKFIVPLDRLLRQGDWRQRYGGAPSLLLSGRRVLILGYGAIGRQIAPLCQALGMQVNGVRRHPPTQPVERGVTVHAVSELHALLPATDILICVLPQTPETVGLIGAAELALLPQGAVVVNVGRGPVIDEAALYAALRSGHLAAAGIDVWYVYPHGEEERAHTLPSHFPFHELDNVVLSPHRGGWLEAAEERRLQELATLLTAAANGQPMPNLVDKQLGY